MSEEINETLTENEQAIASPIALDSIKAINLPKPHGFLIWRGKQTAIANPEPLPADEPLYLTSEDEVFGLVTLGKPGQFSLTEFERPEWADKHKVRPEERRLLWPEVKAMYVQQIKAFEGWNRPRHIIDGYIVEYRPSRQEWELIEKGQKLPKQIILSQEAVCLTADNRFVAIKEAQKSEELSKILESVYEGPVQFAGIKHKFSLPLYSLALVRQPNPRMRVEKILKKVLSAEKAHTGVMVAFMLDPEIAQRLALSPATLPSGSEPLLPEELHLTLIFLGDSGEFQDHYSPVGRELLEKVLSVFAQETRPLIGKLGGIGRFDTIETDGSNALYASLDSGQLPAFREELVRRLGNAGIESPSVHGFTPHITLAYLPQGSGIPNVELPVEDLAFTRLTLAWGDEYIHFPFLAQKKSTNGGGMAETEIITADEKQHSIEEQLEQIRGKFRAQFGDDWNDDPWIVDILDNGFVVANWDGCRYLVQYTETEAGIVFAGQPAWIEATVSYMPKSGELGEFDGLDEAGELDHLPGEDQKQFDESPWDGAASNWDTPEAYCKDCLIDVNSGGEKTKSLCFLPYRKPGSTRPNKAAIQAIGGGRGITRLKKPSDVPQDKWDSAVKRAASRVISWWPEAFDKPAPAAIYQAAGKEPPEGEAGKEGRRLRTIMIDKLRGAMSALQEFVGWAEYADLQEEEAPTLLMADFFKGNAGFTVKEVNGEPWHFTWSTNAFMDRDQEIFSLKALNNYVTENSKKQHKGFFNFWHIPGTDFAEKKFQAIVGKFLVEAGPYLKDEKGRKALEFFKQYSDGHPDIAPEGWGSSPEYRYLPEERPTGVYGWLWITRTSTLPKAAAANIFTESKQEFVMDAEQRKGGIAIFGEDFVNDLIKEGEARTKKLEEAGVPSKAKKKAEAKAEETDQKQKIGRFIRSKREGAEMTVAQLAEATDLTASVINAIESGEEQPSMAQIRALANALEADVDEMAGMMEEEEAGAGQGQGAETGKESEAGKGEEAKTEQSPALDVKEFVNLIAAKMMEDLRPAIEGPINQLSQEIQQVADRVGKLEKAEGLKKETDLSRYINFQIKRASEAEETAVDDTDELKNKKPAETTPVGKDGSVAGAFFPTRK